jgi:hypothetical protein
MSIQEKLNDGRDCLRKAVNEPMLLSNALTAIHGALEDACRSWLSAPNLKSQHGVDVQDLSQSSWQVLLKLMPQYCGWRQSDVRYVAKMNSLRNKTAHGSRLESSHSDIEKYLTFVEGAIARGGTPSAEPQPTPQPSSSRSIFGSTSASTREGGAVKPFRFYIQRTAQGVRLCNRLGACVIAVDSVGEIGRRLLNCVANIATWFIIFALGMSALQGIPLVLWSISMMFVGVPLVLLMTLVGRLGSPLDLLLSRSTVLITPSQVYLGARAYDAPGGTYFRFLSQGADLFKFHFVTPNGAVYFAKNLTWHEADELLKIAISVADIIEEPRSSFAITLKDQMIYINSFKTDHSFVLEYDDRLWQNLRCRMPKSNVAELTKSELKELYSMKLQSFKASVS